jgi:2-hydroxy-6-oxonona-2,4-dienedioate hydrolase
MIDIPLREHGDFKYIETGGDGTPLLLLHGLFGALSNFEGIIKHFAKERNVVVPLLPIFEGNLKVPTVMALVDYVSDFVKWKGYSKFHVLGNSLGGHISILFVLANPEKVLSITLTGSSGLFESGLGSTFPKRGDYNYVKTKSEGIFYDPAVAKKELVDEVYETINNRVKALRIVWTAKSALRQNLADKLHDIKVPTLLVWGKQDNVTPPEVAEKFNELIPDTKLIFVDKCGHAPMMEHPGLFNEHLEDFLRDVENKKGEWIAHSA